MSTFPSLDDFEGYGAPSLGRCLCVRTQRTQILARLRSAKVLISEGKNSPSNGPTGGRGARILRPTEGQEGTSEHHLLNVLPAVGRGLPENFWRILFKT